MNNKNIQVAENSFFKYQEYEKTAREDIKKFILEEELKDVTITKCEIDGGENTFELNISGDKYWLYLERGYLVLDDKTEKGKTYFESVAECFEFIGVYSSL